MERNLSVIAFEVERMEIWERSSNGQKQITVPKDSSFEAGEKVAIIREEKLDEILEAIEQ